MDVKLNVVESLEEANTFMRWLGQRRPVLGVDTETGGLEWWNKRLRLVQFGDAETGWAVPWEGWGGVALEALARWDGPIAMHNAKFDAHFLEHHGRFTLPRGRIHDTRIMAHLLDPVSATGLKPLAARLLDRRAGYASKILEEAMAKQRWGWDDVPLTFEAYWAYGALDAVYTAQLYERFSLEVSARYRQAYEVERAVSWVIADMERRGARIDLAYTQRKLDELQAYVASATDWCRRTHDVSPTSILQVAQRIKALGVDLSKTTGTGKLALDEEVLLAVEADPNLEAAQLARTVHGIRKVGKIAATYLENFIGMSDGEVLHPSINTLGARTGRMSVQAPALQTLPRGRIVRDCFIPRDERSLVLADFDQIELRLLAHFAGVTDMLEAMRRGEDIHNYTAQQVYADGSITKRDPRRQLAKNAGFAKIYGAGTAKFALTADVDFEVADEFLKRYDAMFPEVRRFQRSVESVALQRAAAEGEAYVTTPLGRRQPCEHDKLYTLVNYLIQGTAADVLKQQLVDLDLAGFGEYMILPVHDEIVFDVPTDLVAEALPEIVRVMSVPNTFHVPLTVAADVVQRWGDKYG